MTDKARELLERTLKQLNPWHPGMGEQQFDYTLREEIRAYLAEPEVKREALSLAEISAAYLAEIAPEYPQADADEYKWMVRGVRFAEKHHQIHGGDDA